MAKRTLLLLISLLAVAALLRFWGLGSRGFMIWDEAYYALEGRTVPAAASYLAGGGPVQGLPERLVSTGCILPTGTAKPGFMLLFSAWGIVFGSSDLSGLAMTAFSGVVCVLLVFWAGYRYYGASAGLVAAFLLTFSGFHIWYSRSMLSNQIAAAIFMSGLLLYLRAAAAPAGRKAFAAYLLTGTVMGFAFTVHYALLPNLAVLAVLEALRFRERRGSLKDAAAGTLAMGLGFMAVLAAAELAYVLLYGALGDRLGGIAHLTYFQYIVRQFLWVAPLGKGPAWAWRLYVNGFVEFNGWPSALLYLAALAGSVQVFVRNGDFAARVFIAQAWGTLLFWTFSSGPAAMRVFSVFAPLSAVVAGLSAASLAARLSALHKRVVYAAVALCVLGGAALSLPGMYSARSVYPEVASWLSARNAGDPVSMLEWPFLQFYLGSKVVNNQDRIKVPADLEKARKAGARYLVLTNTEEDWLRGPGSGRAWILGQVASPEPEVSWRVPGGRFLAYDGLVYPQHISEVKIYPLKSAR